MLPTNLTPAITVDELKKSRVWMQLSPQQQTFLTEYLSAGPAQGRYNELAACRLAYPKVNIKNIKVWLSRLQANPRIRAVLAYYFGDPTEGLLDDIKALIKKSRRKNAHRDLLLAPWLRVADALEEIAAKENTLDVKDGD
jgi:hypothetical protein